jgi:hypothetical protein
MIICDNEDVAPDHCIAAPAGTVAVAGSVRQLVLFTNATEPVPPTKVDDVVVFVTVESGVVVV